MVERGSELTGHVTLGTDQSGGGLEAAAANSDMKWHFLGAKWRIDRVSGGSTAALVSSMMTFAARTVLSPRTMLRFERYDRPQLARTYRQVVRTIPQSSEEGRVEREL